MSIFLRQKKFYLTSPAIIFAGIFLLVLVGVTVAQQVSAAGATYYVDNTDSHCNDSFTTAQNSITQPWCTISRANSAHGAGDTVVIKQGVYRETIVPKAGLSNTQRTVYTGLSADPSQVVVKGSDVVTGWEKYAGNIYRAPFQAGDQCRLSGGSAITVQNTNCWADGETWFKRGAHTQGGDALVDLDAPGEFFYDQQAHQLYVWMPQSDSPNSHLIECSKRPAFNGGGQYTALPEVNNFILQRMTITQTLGRGISFNSNPHRPGNITIQENRISYTTGSGYCASNPAAIYHGNSDDYTPDIPNFQILRNTIFEVGSDRGGLNDPRIGNVHAGAAVQFYTVKDSVIDGNTIYRAFQPVAMKAGDTNITISNNRITTSGEGIWIGSQITRTGAPTDALSATITGNLIYNLNTEGAQAAVYTSEGNTKVNIYNNTFYSMSGLRFGTEPADTGYKKDNVHITLRNNIWAELWSQYSRSSMEYMYFSWNSLPTSTSDYNLFTTTTYPALYFAQSAVDRGAYSAITPTRYASLSGWQSATGNDLHSLSVNPQFADPGAEDFQLQLGSRAIDAGTVIPGYHCSQSDDVNPDQTDCRHWKGAAPDIGAFEYGIASSQVGSVSNMAPNTLITQAPDAVLDTQRAAFSFSAEDSDSAAASLQYSFKLDSGPWSPWSTKTSTVFSQLTNGSHTFSVRSRDSTGNIDATSASANFSVAYTPHVVMGNEAGASPRVYVVSKTGKIAKQFFAFEKSFRGGVQVALGDFLGDGHKEIVVGSGAGRRGEVVVFTREGRKMGSFLPFGPQYRSGVSVTTADIDDDGIDEIVMSRMKGKPEILLYRFNGSRFINTKAKALAYSSGVSGVSLASGDVDGDGTDEVVAAPAFSGQSVARVFKFSRNRLYLWKVAPRAFRENIAGGFTVATGNLTNDWRSDIIMMPKSSYPTKVQVISMNAAQKLALSRKSLYPFGKNNAGGGRITISDVAGNRTEDVIVTKGSRARQSLFIFDGNTMKRIRAFSLFPPSSRLVLSIASGVLF